MQGFPFGTLVCNREEKRMDMKINWYPGHMTRAKRKIQEALPQVDLIIELLDARAPYSSSNPSFSELFARKPVLTLLTKCTLADPAMTSRIVSRLRTSDRVVIPVDCKTGMGVKNVAPAIRELMAEKLQRNAEKGIKKPMRAMVVGITNVGKSTFINTFVGAKKAKAEDRPGVTRSNQWIPAPSMGVELLDTPGVLWPKFDDQRVAVNLASLGAINDEILDLVELAVALLGVLRVRYPELLKARYKAEWEPSDTDYELFQIIARKRGFIRSGAEVDDDRTAAVLLDEFRAGKIGQITLDHEEGV